MQQPTRVELSLNDQILSLETGKLAKQAHGAVVVRMGDTVVLAAAVEGEAKEGQDFFPLTVDYREKAYAAGKFPGGFIKREGRPSTKEILTARLCDRPIRPLFPSNYFNEVQIQIIVLSADKDHDPDVLSIIGSSAALHLSQIPFLHPTGAVRIGRVGGQLIVMPNHSQMEESDLDLIVAGTKSAVTMIEGFAREMREEEMAEAIMFGHKQIAKVIDLIEQLRKAAGLPDKIPPAAAEPNPLIEIFLKRFADEFRIRKQTSGKLERAEKIKEMKTRIEAEFLAPAAGETEPKYSAAQVNQAFGILEERVVREMILEGQRIDGRTSKQIRSISCEVGVLPRTHGSAIFQRGETQALVVTTLGTVSDEQRVEGLAEEYSKKFMLDYNFPPFSVGECRPIRGPGRREIGHGMLAERSLKAVLPPPAKFPYTVRLVSEILESNGSSSMASVCGGTLALMDAGVPIANPVAGISIGLVKEPGRYVLLTDIMGDEDHFGDMDFKVAGTQRGITGIQLDLKIDGISEEIIRNTLTQAKEARLEIMKSMLRTLMAPRSELSKTAPRLIQIKINPEKIGLLIGPGGKNIKGIQESTGAKIDIDDDGTVYIAHMDAAGADAARARVEAITEEVRVGKVYEGRVTSVKDFGAFIEILPGRDGLCHISELDDKYVGKVEDVCKVGDILQVKVIAIDDQDRVKLSRKVLIREAAGLPPAPPPPPREPRRDRDGGRDRDRDRDGGRRGDGRGRGGDRRPREESEARESREPREYRERDDEGSR
ncbi:MAG TPA: polyribonucleotide nucleotidyltransferase [Gemmataceae bacterium]|nr:polyribonucleotide nucleotidyltransferase [Gemmataceae bacterium]